MNTKRYTLSDAHSTQFYQLPKWLVALRVEAEISNEQSYCILTCEIAYS